MAAVSRAERELKAYDSVFKALAHRSRRHVLSVLNGRGGEMTSSEIAARFSCSWPTTTRHLGVLRQAGLISVTRRGREQVYRLERERLTGVVAEWLGFFEED